MSNRSFSSKNRKCRHARFAKRVLQSEQLEPRVLLAGDMSASWQNLSNCNDVNQDGSVTALDALNVIRSINIDGMRVLPEKALGEPTDEDLGGNASALMIDTNGDNFLSPADALQVIEALNGQGEGETIQLRVEVTDLDGNVISSAEVGDQFQLRGYVQDLRDGDESQGVFAAYADVNYDAALVSVFESEPLAFGDSYPNGRNGDVSNGGVVDEVGAFANGILSGVEELLFTVSMQADAPGTVTFSSDGADILPAHEMLLFGIDGTIDPSDVAFGSVQLSIEAGAVVTPDLVQFAQNLADAGVQFWSSNQFDVDAVSQRELFEDGASFLPMSEFFNAAGDVSEAAVSQGITDMNTWVFPDEIQATGVLTLEEISSRSGVPIPAANGPTLKSVVDVGQLIVEVASPRQLPLDGYDPFGESLSYSVTVDDAELVEATVSTGNRFWSLEVEGYGTMVLELFEDKASRATEQFIGLTEDGFYDGIAFHRVIPNFVIQGGDPLGTGRGGSSLPDFDDQFHVDLRHNQPGVLSMAKSADDTNNSQFFVTHAETPHLDFNHTIFGQLIEGFEVLDGITTAQRGSSDKPLDDIVITKASVFEDPENAILTVRALDSTGSTTVTVTATDIMGNETTQTFDVTLEAASGNAQPFLDDIPDFMAPAGSVHQFQLGHTDIEDDDVFFFADTISPVDVVATVSVGGLVSVDIPSDVAPGTEILIDVTVSESSRAAGNFDRQRVSITVEAAVIGDGVDDSFTLSEDTTDNALDVLANDGLDSSAVIASVTGDDLNGTVTISADGKSILYTPDADFFGEAVFTYAATTDNGDTFSAEITAMVENVVDQPIARDDVFPQDLPEDDPLRDLYVEDSAGDIPLTTVLSNDLNADLNEQELTLITAVTQPEFGTVTWNALQIRYTPAPDFFGQDTLTYTTTGSTSGLSSTGTITVNIAPENDPPIGVDETLTAVSGVARLFTTEELLSNDSPGPENESNQTLQIAEIGYEGTGTAFLNDDGDIEYTSAVGFVGTETIIYAIKDAGPDIEQPLAAFATLTIDVAASGIAVADEFNVAFESSGNVLNVLANDDQTKPLEIISVADSTNGSVTFTSDQIEYTPNADFVGTDSLIYTVRSTGGEEATATVTITVDPEPSVAMDDQFTVDQGSTLDVLANDSLGTGASSLSIDSVVQPTNGVATVIGNEIEYQPDDEFSGNDSFIYTVVDDNGNTSSASVTVTVEGNVSPIANDDAFTVVSPGVQTYNVLANDTGEAGEILRVTAVQADDANGQVSITADGLRILYTPDFSSADSDTFTYTVDDGTGLSAQATVTVNVPDLLADSFFAGSVFTDSNNNGTRNSGERGLGGVTVVLEGTDTTGNEVRRETKTDITGEFRFDGIGPGDYTVSEQQPSFTIRGQNVLGPVQVTSDDFDIEVTEQLISSGGNSFGERGLNPQFASFDNLSSSRQPGLFVVLDGDDLAWVKTEAVGATLVRSQSQRTATHFH